MDSTVRELAEITGLPVDSVLRRIASGHIELTSEEYSALNRRAAEHERRHFERAAEEGDFHSALSWLSSTSATAGLVELEPRMTDEQVRDALRLHWSRCDSAGFAVDDLLNLFHRAGFVTDTKEPKLTGELVIYRRTFGDDDPRDGISWTLDGNKARRLAEHRGRGADVDRATAAVWSARVDAPQILGYFAQRGEAEVLVDPSDLRDIERLS
jgi:hypothetical protein